MGVNWTNYKAHHSREKPIALLSCFKTALCVLHGCLDLIKNFPINPLRGLRKKREKTYLSRKIYYKH